MEVFIEISRLMAVVSVWVLQSSNELPICITDLWVFCLSCEFGREDSKNNSKLMETTKTHGCKIMDVTIKNDSNGFGHETLFNM